MYMDKSKVCNNWWRFNRDNNTIEVIDKDDIDNILTIIPIVEVNQWVDEWKAKLSRDEFIKQHEAYFNGDKDSILKLSLPYEKRIKKED